MFRPADYDYVLPEGRIAQKPAEPRDSARLLVLHRASMEHRRVSDLPGLLQPGDLLVVNDTKVLPARLAARRESGGKVEVVLVRPRGDGTWHALVGSKGRVEVGDCLDAGGATLHVVGHEGQDWALRIEGMDPYALMKARGKAPLPPYIRRPLDADPDRERDLERYQTVFARVPGAVAAPTAGLHFTPGLLQALHGAGVSWTTVTLHVGPGTFRTDPGRPPEPEEYEVPAAAQAAVKAARRVVAVGTTAARALETWAATGEAKGSTGLLIAPGHRFLAVQALMTNFHLPRTSLLALACAFGGRDRILKAYAEAAREGYRFYSYGDAMLLVP